MIDQQQLEMKMCAAFCGGISVRKVPAGFAVSTLFKDNSGDRLSFYVVKSDDGYQIEDDGSYLSHLIARDIPINRGSRAEALEMTLSAGQAYWDKDTFEIKTQPFQESSLPQRLIQFTASLIQVRTLELFVKERIRSTFKEDAIAAITRNFGEKVALNENEPVDQKFRDFPADVVMRPFQKSPQYKTAAVYFVSSSERLSEALLLQQEVVIQGRDDIAVIALIEDAEMSQIGRSKFQRAQNRNVIMPIFRGDEDASMNMMGGRIGVRPLKAA